MSQSLEQRLQALYDKRSTLEAQIKQIEAEKSKELRKRQDTRERLVGKAVYALVQSGEWTEAQMLDLMDAYLKRAADRKLFGLAVDENRDTLPSAKPAESTATDPVKSDSRKSSATKGAADSSKQKSVPSRSGKRTTAATTATDKSTSARRKKTGGELPESIGQDDLLDEFNL
jgi:septal ring factor EnvC (AmiA/AmiB activator)